MDRFAVMATFVRVAERGSFTRAADDLGISRAQASQQVAALEKRLGVRLFDRTTRRVALSNDGAEYLERAQRILADVAQADAAMSRTRERPHGRLRIDVPVAFGRNLLIPALPGFRERYPELKLELRFNDRLVDLLAEKVDIALRFGPVRDGRLIARRLYATRWITCAAPAYVAAHGVPLQPQGLAGHQCIGYLAPDSGRVREWQFGKGRARLRQRVDCALAFDNAEAILAAGIAGGGIFQASHLLASRPMAAGLLQQLLGDHAVDGPVGSIVYPGSARHSVAVRVFGDFIAGLMREHTDKVETVAGRAQRTA